MSSDIVYRIKAIKLPKELTSDYDDHYIVCEEAGSSNCWETQRNRRARSWQVSAIGMHYRVIEACCERAGSCEGGMLKLYGRSCKPEAYIKAWRNALAKAAVGFDGAIVDGFMIIPKIVFSENELANGAKYHFDELSKKRPPAIAEKKYGAGYKFFEFDHTKPDDLKLWLQHCHGRGFNNAEVVGPRD